MRGSGDGRNSNSVGGPAGRTGNSSRTHTRAPSSGDNVARPKPAQLRRETTVVGHSTPTAAAIVTGGGGALPSSHHGYDQQRPSQQPYNQRNTNSNSSTSSQSQSSSQSSSQPPTQPSSRSNTIETCFGIVVSIKETFGFIQPLIADEQIFFSLHGTHGLSMGDEVSYIAKSTSKGMQADNVRVLEASKKAYLQGVRGVITREPDQHRGTPGLIEVLPEISKQLQQGDTSKLSVPFLADDFLSGSGSSSSGGGSSTSPSKTNQQRRIVKGDEVELTLSKVNGLPLSAYSRGTHCKVLRTKRDRLLAEQVQQMLSVGAVREQGIIETIRNNEFGFIKPADRTEQIYFRVDDVIDQEIKISEGMEVEFFGIVENSKGKMSDRAVHLQVLPSGTVIFEYAIAEQVEAVVVAEPKFANKEEEPGLARLRVPVVLGNGKPDLASVELWSRCVPEGFIFKVGDILSLDVQHYRPEKIHFARKVKMQKYRALGRETGVVCAVKDQGFGFVRSHLRDTDMYFRTNEILGSNGENVAEAVVVPGLSVSFDVAVDESNRNDRNSSGGSNSMMGIKLKAIRVQELVVPTAPQTTSTPGIGAIALAGGFLAPGQGLGGDTRTLIDSSIEATALRAMSVRASSGGAIALVQGCVRGVVIRDAKRDVPGIIRLNNPAPEASIELTHPELIDALKDFRDTPELTEITLDNIPSSLRKIYHTLLTERFPGIAHETPRPGLAGGNKGQPLRLWKLGTEEYQQWLIKSQTELTERSTDSMGRKLVDMRDMRDMGLSNLSSSPAGGDGNNGNENIAGGGRSENQSQSEVFFHRADTYDEFGPISKDLDVYFDLCLDKKTNKRVARHVHLIDEGVPGMTGDHVGLLDVVVVRNGGKYGFIRCLPSDEKLFWHSSGAASGVLVTDLIEGGEVAFQMRRRGGLRCATTIRILPPGSLNRDVVLDGRCVGVVVEDNSVVILDASHCPAMSKKYWDITRIGPLMRKEAARAAKKRAAALAAGTALTGLDGQGLSDGSLPPPPPLDFTDLDGGLDGLDGDEGVIAEEDVRGAKFFPPLIRSPLPIVLDPTHTQPVPNQPQFQLGDIVQCRVVANWAVSRHPLRAFDVLLASPSVLPLGPVETTGTTSMPEMDSLSLASGQPLLRRLKSTGTVCRSRVRIKGGGVDGAGYELTEIREQVGIPPADPTGVSPGTNALTEGAVFYCDCREPRTTVGTTGLSSEITRDTMQTGDEVEFIGLRHLGVAVAVQLMPRQIRNEGIIFKRAPVNAELKSTIKNTGFKGISMAEGPPDDGKTIGFPSGWREESGSSRLTLGASAGTRAGLPVVVTDLPWSHLLRHLFPPGTITASAPEFVPSATSLAAIANATVNTTTEPSLDTTTTNG